MNISSSTGRWRRITLRIGLLALVPMILVGYEATAASAAPRCYAPRPTFSVAQEKRYWIHADGNTLRTYDAALGRSYPVVDGRSYRWDKELWQGDRFYCPVGKTCHYTYGQAVTKTSQWQVGGLIQGQAGDAEAQGLLAFTPSYGRSSSVTWNTQYALDMTSGKGEWAQAYMATKFEHQWGRTMGAWVSPGWNGTPCTANFNSGFIAEWHPDWHVGYWTADVRLYDFYSFYQWR